MSKLLKVHIALGVASVLLPLFLFGWEHVFDCHAPLPIYLSTIILCLAHAIVALMFLQRRVPAYDIPAIRGFMVSVGAVISFVGVSLMFHDRFGPSNSYEPVGKLFSLISLYSVIYAWSDAVGSMRHHLGWEFRGPNVGTAEKPWVLPFERSSYRYMLVDCLVVKPTRKGFLRALYLPTGSLSCPLS